MVTWKKILVSGDSVELDQITGSSLQLTGLSLNSTNQSPLVIDGDGNISAGSQYALAAGGNTVGGSSLASNIAIIGVDNTSLIQTASSTQNVDFNSADLLGIDNISASSIKATSLTASYITASTLKLTHLQGSTSVNKVIMLDSNNIIVTRSSTDIGGVSSITAGTNLSNTSNLTKGDVTVNLANSITLTNLTSHGFISGASAISASGLYIDNHIQSNTLAFTGFSFQEINSDTSVGSNIFGQNGNPSLISHQFTGSVLITGSLSIPGYNDVGATLTSINTKTGSIENTLTSLNTKTGSLESSITALNTKTGSLETDVATALSGVANLTIGGNTDIDQDLTVGGDIIITDVGSLTGLSDSVDSLNVKTGSLDIDITNLSSDISDLRTKTGSLETDITNLQTATGSINAEISNLKTKTESIDISITSLNVSASSIAALNLETGSISSSLASLNNATASLNTSVTTLLANDDSINLGGDTSIGGDLDTTGNADIEGNVTITGNLTVIGDSTLSAITGDIDSLNLVTASLETDITNLQTATGSLETDITNLQTKTGSLETDITNLQTATSSLESFKSNVGNALTFTGTNVTVLGDLSVQGEANTITTQELTVEDRFILIGSGSTGNEDIGIIFSSGSITNDGGRLIYYDANRGRFGTAKETGSNNANLVIPDIDKTGNLVTVKSLGSALITNDILVGGEDEDAGDIQTPKTPHQFGEGEMVIDINKDIWIYVED